MRAVYGTARPVVHADTGVFFGGIRNHNNRSKALDK